MMRALLFALPSVATALQMSAGGAPPKMAVMINGLPGAMGREIAAACLRRGVELVPFGLTGPDCGGELSVDDGCGGAPTSVRLYEADGADEVAERLRTDYPNAVCIDFTLPRAVNPNAEWYAKHGLPFVMGTTGGDREALMACVEAANTYCVIAPNMAKQIVALQAALEGMGADFPGSFGGYELSVQESHQSSKVDTSGTAKAISANLAQLTGAPFANEQIEKVRIEEEQLAGGGVSHRGVSPVPKEALPGHAFHTYSLLSGDGQVEFQFRHNVQGRSVYAEGAVDAAVFLASRVAAEEAAMSGELPMVDKRQFTMVDVLRSGAM